MVFNLQCISAGAIQEAGPPLSIENFYTENSNFDSTTPREYIPNLNVRSSNLRVFSLADLNEATNYFDESSKIGEGGFGSVYMGVVKRLEPPFDDIRVAVKRGRRGQTGYRQWETEVNILGEVRHHNLVKLIGYCKDEHENDNNWLLVYEYMPNGSVDDHLSPHSRTPLSWCRRLKIALDAAIGLTYLHLGMGAGRQVLDNGYCHYKIIFRDFKPSNVLLDENWNAKLSDFGFAREIPQDGRTHVSTAVVGTKGYADPEYIQTGRLTFKNDIWSYGVFLEDLVTGRRPNCRQNSENNPGCMGMKCYNACARKSKLVVDPRLGGNYSEISVQKICSIARKCKNKNLKKRPTMSEVLQMVRDVVALENQQALNGGQS